MKPVETEEEQGRLSHLDRHFADFLTELAGSRSEELWSAVALASRSLRSGNVCLDLESVAGRESGPLEAGEGRRLRIPGLKDWITALRASSAVGLPGDYRPLILDSANRLYLYRYWKYEKQLADFVRTRLIRPARVLNQGKLRESLQRLFPTGDKQETDWQQVAALAAVSRGLTIITGGPGTGKTATVVKILVLLLEQSEGTPLQMALSAPTGKAAARLQESLRLVKDHLDCSDSVRSRLPTEATTVHRLLGASLGSTRYRFNEKRPLPHDVVVVDECSMIDLPLMAKLVQAIRDPCRLILVGDADQLSSVEPGAVLGQLCAPGARPQYSRAFVDQVKRLGGETAGIPVAEPPAAAGSDSVVTLQRSYRFGHRSGIGRFSREVNRGNADGALQVLHDRSQGDITFRETGDSKELEQALEKRIPERWAPYLRANSMREAWELFEQFQILCAQWRGPWGVTSVNQRVEQILARANLIRPRGRWYRGQPVLVTRNDHHLKIFNGDIGLLFPEPGAQGSEESLRAFFPAGNGLFRSIPPGRLPAHRTAYAITVHRSQGSEFDRVLLILPTQPSAVLTRELIYTAITRARKEGEIWGTSAILRLAVEQQVSRHTGLRDALTHTALESVGSKHPAVESR